MTDQQQARRRPTLWRSSIAPADDVKSVKLAIARHVQSSLGRDEYSTSPQDRFHAVCLSVRDTLIERWITTQQTYYHADARRVYYLSLEFLMGRTLRNALINLDLEDVYDRALRGLGSSLSEVESCEVDAGLGNGGLGRLAACFLDSMATQQLPAYGYGLRYDYGMFRQEIHQGRQVEEPDDWLEFPNPWEIPRPDYNVRIRFGGRVQVYADDGGRLKHDWVDTHDVLAMAYDTPIPGYRNNTVNTLRLWRARGTAQFDLEDFNVGDYIGAVEHKVLAENITKVLYPSDNLYAGQELRLQQQYLLVAATLQDVIRRHLVKSPSLENLHEKVVFQLNDTHPALAVAELMRILLDERGYEWEQSWSITKNCFAYTNHTLLPEALETWPVDMLGRLLPRHLQIINEMNGRFLKTLEQQHPGDHELLRRVSMYAEDGQQRIRMAHLAVIGSFSVNGVAELHSELLKTRVLPDFFRLWPERFNNKTNGITQRRWLRGCNKPLAAAISERIGDGWTTNLKELAQLKELAGDESLLAAIGESKRLAKQKLVEHVASRFDLQLDSASLFDIHIKRIHEYKRQLLNILHVIHLYLRLKRNIDYLKKPRSVIFGGKAAPGYTRAKTIIKLINDVASVVNSDPKVSQRLRVLFFPNYNVTAAELLIPAADISEQISTAGFEASGTGNMKFALNGAVTLGTRDGANIEIEQAVGGDNVITFGLEVEQVQATRQAGYNPRKLYEESESLREVLDLVAGDFFSRNDPGTFNALVEDLLNRDYFLVLADFEAYRSAQLKADALFADSPRWSKMCLQNIANMGPFSSDRTIHQYAEEIWRVRRYPIDR